MDQISRRTFGLALGAAAVGGPLHALSSGERRQARPEVSKPDELCDLSAVDLATRLRRKDVSARDVMAAHLARIERVNPKVNAIVTLVADRAMADAAKADELAASGRPLGVLHGLPVAHKDLVDTAGIRTTRGSRFYENHIPVRDALIVSRIKTAGAITCGKTNTPELGAGSQTFNEVFGATRNPYDVSKTCGGSSGGAAVALACGMVPIADGSDTGGSLRNPAAFCNVVGLRPSPGRVPTDSTSWSPLSVSGPIARSVADVALFLSAIAIAEGRSPLSLSDDPATFRRPLDRSFKGVRVAWWQGLGG
ncbi:MAG: amidase family protein, partial [Acidobacteriota bacterium]|nr:amidase family protein [Acidobacteriota bacterium]